MNWQDAALGMAGVIGCCVVFSRGQADFGFGQTARAAALAFQHDQLVPWWTRINRRCKLVRAERKARDGRIRWQPLLVWRSR